MVPSIQPKPEAGDWYRLSAEEVLARVGSGQDGLSIDEAATRLAANGPNDLRETHRVRWFPILAGQFKSLIIWILIVAGVVSAALGERVDAVAILAIVVLNAVIGFYQEFRAENSIAALQKLTAPLATVHRGGRSEVVSASHVVVGDILVLEAGDLVAADARLLEAASLRCMEAPLTGESDAVRKQVALIPSPELALGDRANLVFRGTSVAAGMGRGVVVATSMNTELGRIAGLLDTADGAGETPLQEKLASFGRTLIGATLALVAVLFGLGLMRGTPLLELFMTSVSLAVAAVPEGLPAVATVALGLGVVRMARRHALIRRLPAVETLGSTTVICTDKTGTLTVGEMTVQALYVASRRYEVTGQGYAPVGAVTFEGRPITESDRAPLRELATCLLGCNHAHLVQEESAWKAVGDPTEGALLAAGRKAGGDRGGIETGLPTVHENPFDSERKLSSVVRRKPDGTFLILVNGAPDLLLSRCTRFLTESGVRDLTDEDRRRILEVNATMAREALRVLGSATGGAPAAAVPGQDRPPGSEAGAALASDGNGRFEADVVERDLVFVGLSGMHDPPRPEAKAAVARCQSAGIRVVMITGDHPETAMAIAREIGVISGEGRVVAGVELEKWSEAQLRKNVGSITVYARVSAEHKLRIIRAWKTSDAVVAMTGDGINDAPAIRGADIGIAMGRSGTEVTKQAADMVVTDDNFASIVAAVEEGRGIYDNIRKTLQYLLAGNTGELLLMAVCLVSGFPLPLLPIHLLWINLVTDGLPALCLATDPIDPDVMKRRPRRRSERITDPRFLRTLLLTGILTAGVAFGVFVVALKNGTVEIARTEAFAVLVYAELLRAFGTRSATKPVWTIPLGSNLPLLIVVGISMGLQVWSHHNEVLGRFLKTGPVPVMEDLRLLALGAIPMLVLEAVKGFRRWLARLNRESRTSSI